MDCYCKGCTYDYPRSQFVCLEDTSYYQITTRCVSRAFLCGTDHYSGRCYEHRRESIRERIAYLPSVFSIEIAAYAVISKLWLLRFFAVFRKQTRGPSPTYHGDFNSHQSTFEHAEPDLGHVAPPTLCGVSRQRHERRDLRSGLARNSNV
ncbi:MAG: hypothetical protein ACI9SC_002528 [Gammaproteobacteria bacterium]|jgi:hypothetical protein